MALSKNERNTIKHLPISDDLSWQPGEGVTITLNLKAKEAPIDDRDICSDRSVAESKFINHE